MYIYIYVCVYIDMNANKPIWNQHDNNEHNTFKSWQFTQSIWARTYISHGHVTHHSIPYRIHLRPNSK